MIRVLVIGYEPSAIDKTDPLTPSGFDPAKLAQSLDDDLQKMRERGWEAQHLSLQANDSIRQMILDRLGAFTYDCVVIGGGVRVTSKRVPELEIVVNAVREGAPHTPIAFNESADGSAEAAARWLVNA